MCKKLSIIWEIQDRKFENKWIYETLHMCEWVFYHSVTFNREILEIIQNDYQ